MQEALIGVLRAVKTYDPEAGNLFLTYAQTTAENAMLDYVRKCASAIPASGSILSLDASPPGFDPEANVTYADILPDDYNKNPEQLFIRKETNSSRFLIYLYSTDRAGTGSVTYVTSPVPFLCSSFSLFGSNLSHRKNTEMNRASTRHSSFPYSVCFIKV